VQQLTAKLDGILEPTKVELVDLTAQVHAGALQAAAQSAAAQAGSPAAGAPANSASSSRIATAPRQGSTNR
jgi:hypothetical protein